MTASAPLAAAHAAAFVTAGNATFTLRSRKTDARYTYKVSLADKRSPSDADAFFVSLLSGPDNESDYTYLGMIFPTGFRLTRKSRLPTSSLPVRAFAYFYGHVVVAGRVPNQLEIWHEGRCGRCNRRLTVPESIASGIGPECAAKMGVSQASLTSDRPAAPFGDHGEGSAATATQGAVRDDRYDDAGAGQHGRKPARFREIDGLKAKDVQGSHLPAFQLDDGAGPRPHPKRARGDLDDDVSDLYAGVEPGPIDMAPLRRVGGAR